MRVPAVVLPPARKLRSVLCKLWFFGLRAMLQRHGQLGYVAVNLRSREVMARMDVTNLACADGLFDGIICNHVLEHVADDSRALAECYRVLKRGGWAILQVPRPWVVRRHWKRAPS